MENKKKFEQPELTICYFIGELDTLVASGDNYNPYDPDKDYWDD